MAIGVSISNATRVEELNDEILIPVSDGSKEPRSMRVGMVLDKAREDAASALSAESSRIGAEVQRVEESAQIAVENTMDELRRVENAALQGVADAQAEVQRVENVATQGIELAREEITADVDRKVAETEERVLEAANERADGIESSVSALDTKIDDAENRMREYADGSATLLEDKIVGAENRISTAVDGKIESVETRINTAIDGKIERSEERVNTSVDGKITDVENRINSTVDEKIAAIEFDPSVFDGKITEVEGALKEYTDSAVAEANTLASDANKLATDANKVAAAIDGRVAEVKRDVERMGDSVTQVESALGTKADVGTSYTKQESDSKYLTNLSVDNLATKEELGAKADVSALDGKLDKSGGVMTGPLIVKSIPYIAEAEYSGVLGTDATHEGCTFYCVGFRPKNSRCSWRIKYELELDAPSRTNYRARYVVEITGVANLATSASAMNSFASTSYRCIYYHRVALSTDAGINAGQHHYAGINLYNATSYNKKGYERDVRVKLLEAENCEAWLFENMIFEKELDGNFEKKTNFDAYTIGLRHTGDADNTTTQNAQYTKLVAGEYGINSASIIMMDGNGTWQSLTTDSGTGTTKTKNPSGFRFRNMTYSVNAANSGAVLASDSIRQYAAQIDMRNSFNCGSTLIGNKAVYLKGVVKEDGLFYLDDVWYTQDEPTEEDGRVYIYLGAAYNTTKMDFCHICVAYWYKDGAFRPFFDVRGGGDTAELEAKVAEISGKVETLGEQVENAVAEVGTLTERMNGVDVSVESLQVSKDEIEKSVGALGASITTLNAAYNELKKLIETGSTTQRRLFIQNDMDGRNLSAQKGEPCPIAFTFVSQERNDPEAPYEDTNERGLVKIAVRNVKHDAYTVLKQMYVPSGVPQSIDVSDILASGINYLSITATGELTEMETSAYVYNVQLTSLSISAPNFPYWNIFTEDITMPLQIGGDVSKRLFVEVSALNGEYNVSYEVNLGNSVYLENAYNFMATKPQDSGVYEVRAWLGNQDGTVTTRAISYKVIVSNTNDTSNLFAVNGVADEIVNYMDNTLFYYSVMDGSRSDTSLTFTVTNGGEIIYQTTESAVPTGALQKFNYPMEVEDNSGEDFTVSVTVTGTSGELTEPIVFNVNNAHSFAAIPNPSFYLNPRKRSNGQSNRGKIVNDVNGKEVGTTMSGFNWGNDGWTEDNDGNRLLRIMSGSNVVVDYAPFATEVARRGITLEFDYKCDYVTDFAYPIITLLEKDGASFIGLKIMPDDVMLYSSSLKDKDNQSVNLNEGNRIRLTASIMPNVYGNAGFNLVVIYVNGVKNREFLYQSNDYFAQNGKLTIGSDYADVDIYGVRVYERALTSGEVLKNFINWLPNREDKLMVDERNNVLDAQGLEVDFHKVNKAFNCFVIGSPIPSLANPNKLNSSWKMMFAEHPEWNWEINTVPIDKQGTSSSYYWKWNLRGKLASSCVATYADGSTTTGNVNFTPELKKVKKITAKKNFASSMQSHKIGGVNSITDLYREMGMRNDVDGRISTYQVPALGFSLRTNDEGEEVYEFIGLYTIGPDKGDANTFGYDKKKYPELLSIEGSDNAPLGALFRVPYNPNKPYWAYSTDEEALQYNGTNCWDYDEGNPDSEDEPVEVKALYDKSWAPTYNFIHSCSDRIKPFVGTAAQLNAQVATLKSSGYEYWVNGGDLYYYEAAENAFVPVDYGEGTVNLIEQLADKGYGLTAAELNGKTAEEKNTLFVLARIAKFRNEAESVGKIDIRDSMFASNWVLFNAATDNRAKNTYPYIFGSPEEGYLWRWRHDDVDTVWSIINQGASKKGYWVEMFDKYEDGGAVWNGETSVFWNLLDLAFPEEMGDSMRSMMAAMETLGGLKTGSSLDKIYKFFERYYFDNAQKYFSENLYNADTKWTYESAKLAYMAGSYTNDTDPLEQALGDHFSAEQRWIRKRIIYMMSKYGYGVFSTKGTDNITVRAAGNSITYELTPAMWMYPTIANGTTIIHGARTAAGEKRVMEVELGGSGDQQNIILGTSYLQDIGDWHDKQVNGSMIVKGRMLKRLKIGDVSKPITISITSLTLSDCASMQEVDLRRVATLGGVIDLSACSHLKRVLADGTSLVQLVLPDGGGMEYVQYPSTAKYITLRKYPLLENKGVKIDSCAAGVTDFLVDGCAKLHAMQLLLDVMAAQRVQRNTHVLRRVRAVGFNDTLESAEMLDYISALADGSYEGLDINGVAGEFPLPVLDGSVTVNGSAYEDTVETLSAQFPNLRINVNGGWWLRFADEATRIYCIDWYDTDYDGGVSREELAAVTTLRNIPNDVKSFEELKYFTGLTSLTAPTDTSVEEIVIPALPYWIPINWKINNSYMRSFKVMDGADYDLATNNFNINPRLDLLYLPSGIVKVRDYSFRNVNVGDMYLNFGADVPISAGYGDVMNNSAEWIHVPKGTKDAFASTPIWNTYNYYCEYDYEEDALGIRPQLNYTKKVQKVEVRYLADQRRIGAVLTPRNAERDMVYISSDSNVATVDSDGRIERHGNGTCTVRAYCRYAPQVVSEPISITINNAELTTYDKAATIDTRIKLSEDTRMYFKFVKRGKCKLMGAASKWSDTLGMHITALNDTTVYVLNGGNANIPCPNGLVEVYVENGKAVVNGTEVSISKRTGAVLKYIELFSIGCSTAEPNFTGDFIEAKIWTGDKLMAHYVPNADGNGVERIV